MDDFSAFLSTSVGADFNDAMDTFDDVISDQENPDDNDEPTPESTDSPMQLLPPPQKAWSGLPLLPYFVR